MKSLFLILVILGWAIHAADASVVPMQFSDVIDGAKMFSQDAIADAKARLIENERKTGLETRIETFNTAGTSGLVGISPTGREVHPNAEDVAEQISRRDLCRGLVVVLFADPLSIGMEAHLDIYSRFYSPVTDPIKRRALAQIRAGAKDDALRDMVSQIIQASGKDAWSLDTKSFALVLSGVVSGCFMIAYFGIRREREYLYTKVSELEARIVGLSAPDEDLYDDDDDFDEDDSDAFHKGITETARVLSEFTASADDASVDHEDRHRV